MKLEKIEETRIKIMIANFVDSHLTGADDPNKFFNELVKYIGNLAIEDFKKQTTEY